MANALVSCAAGPRAMPKLGSSARQLAVCGRLPALCDQIEWRVFCVPDSVLVTYAGEANDLVPAGCATEMMVVPFKPGITVCDESGNKTHRKFYRGWLQVGRYLPVELARGLPGVAIATIRSAKAMHVKKRPLAGVVVNLGVYDMPRPRFRGSSSITHVRRFA